MASIGCQRHFVAFQFKHGLARHDLRESHDFGGLARGILGGVFRQAFRRAKRAHGEVVREQFRNLTRDLGHILERNFRIGWGNRLERQADDFVTVVMGAGGTAAEAFDHLLETKVLRKLRDRHDTRPDDLAELRQRIEKAWGFAGLTNTPAKSIALLEGEIRRLGRGDD